ncbi:hypothetical protein M436DRAFT_59461 [Aureobasidium namibiae CBS 147.97]|uniref:Uncharacterized protein n=1 Tax=Aureobasidium namibiae CBS 147.97 TaxID=1043004 RepID=A0A074WW88_9PEZI|nr:uncharacterized protein M436DRAFT_59461 [Aureobasidium namibiae CBS 147.97]KEQ77468.1 hypothetical protein M436DRAFT_59461 [Aureobasidium namibiae CBS 147.97]
MLEIAMPIQSVVWLRTRNPFDLPEEQIHPVLWQDMFVSMTDDDYELLQPALILASAIPDDRTTLHFFHALSDPHHHSWINDQNLDDHDDLDGNSGVGLTEMYR